jgi:predicted HAD superfamily Cof-like phosphohydrolase
MCDEIYDVLRFHDRFNIPVPDFPTQLTKQRLAERANFMLEELREFAAAAGLSYDLRLQTFTEGGYTQDIVAQADALVDLVYVAMGTALQLGLPWNELWADVHAANMTKMRGSSDRAYIDVIKPPGWEGPHTAEILKDNGWKE